jgi:hypothetical protein
MIVNAANNIVGPSDGLDDPQSKKQRRFPPLGGANLNLKTH